MLGDILHDLTDPAMAEATLALLNEPALRDRITGVAAAQSRPVGALIAGKIRHLLDHGDETLWLDLLTAMSASPQPGAAAVTRILALAFPDPVRVRITHQA
ncbi:MAG TPA: hypothetical protein VFN42_01510 [Acetobacteraceae bacterium]|nr:hypothetical protein [Acetobacteraceae bacterium]